VRYDGAMNRGFVIDSALEGFRLTRERPGAVALWALVLLVSNAGGLALLLALGLGPALQTAQSHALAPPTPEVASRIEAAAAWLPAMAAGFFLLNVVLYTAVLRAVLSPADSRFGYLRLGRQELRQGVLWLYAGAAAFLYGFVLLVVLALGRALQGSAGGAAGQWLLAASAAAAFVGALYPLVRLSPAPSMTFSGGRVTLFAAWKLTRDRFWSLLACYAVAALLAATVMLLAATVFAPLATAAGLLTGQGDALLHGMAEPDLSDLSAFTRPETFASLALNALVTAPLMVILAAPGPALYRALSGKA
jgi:hypothetical protein